MKNRLSHYLFRSPDEIGFENYIVLIFSMIIIVVGTLGSITNIALNLGLKTIISTALPTLIFTSVYFYSRIKGLYIVSKYAITIFSLVFLNIQWFINYGSTGPVLYLFILIESFILIFFKNKEVIIASILLFLNVTILFLIEYNNPALFGRYPTESARLLDLYIGLIIYFVISIFLIQIALSFYINQRKKAELADKLKSAFLANMSHEIRTPMNGILGFAELLKEPNLTGDEQQQYIRIIEKSGVRMLNIINDIIDISKIEAGLMKVDIQESNINEQMDYISAFFKPEIEAKGMQFICRNGLSSEDSVMNTDREKLFAILTNLVKNAIKYSDQGVISLGYDCMGAGNTSYLQFYVKDTGIGIPKDRQKAIFERFIQADISDKMARQGAGLGLSITKAYVETLGGKIWVESEDGAGSVFYFTLPCNTKIRQKNVDQREVSSEKGDVRLPDLKVLLAEDDETSEILISLTIRDFSREILKADTGKKTVEICRNNPDIDLILMDIQMPDMDGFEASRQIREFNRDVVIIAQTAYGLRHDRGKAIESGCNDYVAKPVSKEKLLTLIQKYFSGKPRIS